MDKQINAGDVKKLREKTFAGMMDCKKALTEAGGNMEKAVEILRKKGVATASKKSTRSTKEGVIASYIHTNHKIGVLVEINCETDFVARNDVFKAFVKDLTMQIAASHPIYLDKENVPQAVIDKESEIIKEQHKKKPENVIEKIVKGNLEKFYSEVCLQQQPFIKNPSIKIKDVLTETIAKIDENINIRRFIRYQLGEEI